LRLLVFGGWFGSRNLGDDAILVGLREIVARAIPGAEITAISTDPGYTRDACGVDAITLQSPRSLLRNREEYISAFRDTDAVIVTGGTPIYDYGHVSRAIHMGLPAAQGKPMALFGVGAKPLRSHQGREITRLLLRGASAISVRDGYSRRVLSQLTAQPITITGDSGLHVPPEAAATHLSRPAAVVCPRLLSRNHRAHYHTQLSQTEINVTRHMVARAADSLADRGYNVYMIPFHAVRPDDDLLEASRIMNLMKSREAEVLERPASPGQALSLLASADLVIGLRLHALVLAAAAGTPVASVDYDPKIGAFMEMAGAGPYVCRPGDGLAALSAAAQAVLDNREELRSRLGDAVEQMRRRIMGEAVRVSGLLRGP
jgi:polysaccharide pyruvyl transferase WcaK-like protein